MGNSSSAKNRGEETVREGVQRLLEAPLSSATAYDEEEQDGVWDAIFHCGDVDGEAFFQAMSIADVSEMRDVQPGNLKLLARKALSNVSWFMEARRKRPPVEVVLSSVRTLTRTLPALMADPALHSWCWKRRALAFFLTYLEKKDGETFGGEQDDYDDDDDGDGREGVKKEEAGEEEEEGEEVVEAYGAVRPAGGRARGDGRDSIHNDFPVCFVSVAVHAMTSLLSFPGFAVDEEASDWDDHYTPIPALHYGIKEASVIWAAGIAVTDHNMREVNHFDSNRLELLRLLITALSLPLFLDTPTKEELAGTTLDNYEGLEKPPPAWTTGSASSPPTSRHPTSVPGTPLANPLAALITSRHLPFSTELFYSLLNFAIVDAGTAGTANRRSNHGGSGSTKGKRHSSWRSMGFGSRNAGVDEKSQSLMEWCLQTLAVLLQHGRPYRELLEERGVFLPEEGGIEFGAIPRPVELAVAQDMRYNCHRKCVLMIHSDEDLDRIALGLLRHLNYARLGKTRRQSTVLSTHQETLMIFAAFVHENPRFVAHIAASEELARGTAVCVCHLLEQAVASMLDKLHNANVDDISTDPDDEYGEDDDESDPELGRGRRSPGGERGVYDGDESAQESKIPLGEDVGLLVLASRLLLRLSEDEGFMAMLVILPVGGRRGEFSAPEMETDPGMSLLDVMLSLSVWALAKASDGVGVAAPALAAVARNGCPFLEQGMRSHTADWMLDALEYYVGNVAESDATQDIKHHSTPAVGGAVAEGDSAPAGGVTGSEMAADRPEISMSAGVASLLLEGLAAAAAFHHERQGELVLAMVKRSLNVQHKQQHIAGNNESGQAVGVLCWLAARGGLLDRYGAEGGGKSNTREMNERVEAASEDSWFKMSVVGNPWEGWPMRRVLWPLLSTLIEMTAVNGGLGKPGTSPEEAEANSRILMACARNKTLRPLGLCPPWEDSDDNDGQSTGGARDAKEKVAIDAGKAVGGAGAGVGLEHPKRIGVASFVASALSAVKIGGPGGATVTDIGGGGDGGAMATATLASGRFHEAGRSTTVAGSGAFFHMRDGTTSGSGRTRTRTSGGSMGRVEDRGSGMDWVSRGADMVDGDACEGANGGGGRVDGLTRVVAVEEPWQSIYLWSLLYVKTTEDVPLFDHRAVRLFEIMTEESSSGSGSSSSSTNGGYSSGGNDHLSYGGSQQGSGSECYLDDTNSSSDQHQQRQSQQRHKQPEYSQEDHQVQKGANFMYSKSGKTINTAVDDNNNNYASKTQTSSRGLGFGSSSRGVGEKFRGRGRGGSRQGRDGELDGIFEAGGGVRAEELV